MAAKRAPTAADFFARHPQLHPFLLAQLGEAAAALNGGDGSSSGQEVHPSLFPVLVLLSRLRPSQLSRLVGCSSSSSLEEQRLSPAAFAPLLQRCAAARPAAVRQLAAASLPPLLPPTRQPAVAAELAEDIAEAVAGAAAAARGGAAAALRPSFNTLHGQLLQLRALLDAAATAAEPAATAALLEGVAGPLTACATAACMLGSGNSASGSYVPAAVSLEYIRTAAAAAALLPALRRAQGEAAAETALETAAWITAVQRRCWSEIER